MFTQSTLRSVMSALSLALVATTFVAPAAYAGDQTKTDRSIKMVRPLSAIVKGIKHLFGNTDKSPNSEPSEYDGDYMTDPSDLPISG